LKVWGTRPGENNILVTPWKNMNYGDYVLIFYKGKLDSIAQVSMTVQNNKLAEHLWGKNSAGEIWEYVYFLHNFKEGDMSQKDVWPYFGYKPKFVLRGFIKADDKKIMENNPSVESLIHNLDPSYKPEDLLTDFEVSKQEEKKAQSEINKKLKGTKGEERKNKLAELLEEHSKRGLKNKGKVNVNITKGYHRNSVLTNLVKIRDNYTCRICNEMGFEKENGGYYVETHHIKSFEEGGTDTADNMVAICPNCHAKLTYGSSNIKEEIMKNI